GEAVPRPSRDDPHPRLSTDQSAQLPDALAGAGQEALRGLEQAFDRAEDRDRGPERELRVQPVLGIDARADAAPGGDLCPLTGWIWSARGNGRSPMTRSATAGHGERAIASMGRGY